MAKKSDKSPVYVILDENQDCVAVGENEKECLDCLSDVMEGDAWEPEQTDKVTLRMYKMVKSVEIDWTPNVRAV